MALYHLTCEIKDQEEIQGRHRPRNHNCKNSVWRTNTKNWVGPDSSAW